MGIEYLGLKSCVKVYYYGELFDGMVFDSLVECGEFISFGLN